MDDRVTLRFLAAPQDAAADGRTVAAGRVLEWIDKAGYACAVGWSSSYCVTAYVGNVHFTGPIAPGDLVEATGRIIHTGRSSMQVLVTVRAADVRTREFHAALDCLLVFVAVGEDRWPRPVPQWEPTDDAGRVLAERAEERLAARREIKEAMLAEEYTSAGTTPVTTFRFLAAPGDANYGGNAHGGTVMRWIDETAFATAASWSTTGAVAVYSGGIHFLRPIPIGHVVELQARLIHTGPRSMHIAVQVWSWAPITPEARDLTTTCMTVFVVPGADGRATPVDQLALVSAEDVRLDAHARALIELRSRLERLPL
ncbi:acyl-CoA thioesterase [Cnuibacter physcomitrellae]|uniref:Acyl-CoA thioesterase n=1 Tax=Cnuibacter physcomitrellae TaxID=1619308 RepID=A0A1X9LQY2_9MICO|nr:hotdog domain-containing protein [Cnuibacter physcomitrellae]ARJ04310.1 acyl-CoA thioesterase [Cnuibacter physcomitrellae]GGI40738.1 acyl-CoA thioesterase [Cnuibacter physcomitrellae]